MDISEDYGDEGNPIQLKSQFLRDFCQLVLNSKELSAQECSLVDRAALITYQKYLLHPEREQMPSLHDFYNNLSLQGPQAKALTMALSMYVDGTMDLFAHQTNVDLQNHCICFNTVKLGKSMQSIGMMTVLDQSGTASPETACWDAALGFSPMSSSSCWATAPARTTTSSFPAVPESGAPS